MNNENIINLVTGPEDIKKRNRSQPYFGALFDMDDATIESPKTNFNNHLSTFGNKPVACYSLPKNNAPYHADKQKRLSDIERLVWQAKKRGGDPKQNLIQFPEDYYDLFQQVVIDLTRRRQDDIDFTGIFTNESTRLDAPLEIPIRELLDFTVKFGEWKPEQPVNMVEQKTGALGTILLTIYAAGHARTLFSVLFDEGIWSYDKVISAVTRAYTGERNMILMNLIINTVYHASQIQQADTAGATYDINLYNTILHGYEQLLGLLDMQTRQPIAAPRTILLCRDRVIATRLNRIIQGRLIQTSTNSQQFIDPIGIDEIIYFRGDSWPWKGDTVTVPGVPAGEAYLFVPGTAGAPWWTINKAPLTTVVGSGDVLRLQQERRAWWWGQGAYHKEFFGSSSQDHDATFNSGYGYIVKIGLPQDIETT